MIAVCILQPEPGQAEDIGMGRRRVLAALQTAGEGAFQMARRRGYQDDGPVRGRTGYPAGRVKNRTETAPERGDRAARDIGGHCVLNMTNSLILLVFSAL